MLVRFVQVLGLAALSLSVTLAASPAFAQRPSVGEPAPSFGLPVANVPGVQRYSLEEDILESSAGLNVLSFFSMSCEPCKRELGYFNQLVAALTGKINVYVIDIDKESEQQEQAKALFAEKGIKLPLLLDRFQIVVRRYHVDTLPSCFFLDGSGKVVKASTGYNEEIRTLIADVIRSTLGVEPPEIAVGEKGEVQAAADGVEEKKEAKSKAKAQPKAKAKAQPKAKAKPKPKR